MKKLLLTFLALAGMLTGLTLTSCGGGGSGDNDGPAYGLSNVRLDQTGPANPLVSIQLLEPVNGWTLRAIYSFGSNENWPGYFNLLAAPAKTDTGGWVIKGSSGITNEAVTNDNGLKTWLGLNQIYSLALKNLTFTLTFTDSRSLNGSYNGEVAYRVKADGTLTDHTVDIDDATFSCSPNMNFDRLEEYAKSGK